MRSLSEDKLHNIGRLTLVAWQLLRGSKSVGIRTDTVWSVETSWLRWQVILFRASSDRGWMHRFGLRNATLPGTAQFSGSFEVQTAEGRWCQKNKKKKKFGGEKGCRLVGCLKFLRDDLQDVEDQLHDHRALAQLTRPAVNDGDQSAVQVAQVLRQERLAVASDQITHLRRMKGWSHTKDLV